MDSTEINRILLVLLIANTPLLTASQSCIETVTRVLKCPSNASEYKKRESEKCSKACGNSKGVYEHKYHCMLDSTHEELLEMCAIQKVLFSFCPMYDQNGHQIQKDESRPCYTSSMRPIYNSSDNFYCDLSNCLELHAASGTTSGTTPRTQINDGENRDHLKWIIPVVLISITTIVLIIIFYKKCQSKESSNCFQILTPDCWKSPTKGNKKNEQIEDLKNGQDLLSGTADNAAGIV